MESGRGGSDDRGSAIRERTGNASSSRPLNDGRWSTLSHSTPLQRHSLTTLCATASKSRHLKRGVKEVVKSIRKGEKGSVFSLLRSLRVVLRLLWDRIIVLAADISPVDILTHLPLLAEEASCPYIVRHHSPSPQFQ